MALQFVQQRRCIGAVNVGAAVGGACSELITSLAEVQIIDFSTVVNHTLYLLSSSYIPNYTSHIIGACGTDFPCVLKFAAINFALVSN